MNGEREVDRQSDHHGERNDRLEPLLQEQFGEQQPWRPCVANALCPTAERFQGGNRHRPGSSRQPLPPWGGGGGASVGVELLLMSSFFGVPSAAVVGVGGLGTA